MVAACRTSSTADASSDGDAELDASADAAIGCSSDSECAGGFCDRTGRCENEDLSKRFGVPCQWSPNLPSGQMDGRLFTECAAYLCFDGRCRSCAADAECRILSGSSGQCRLYPGFADGYRCGNYRQIPEALPPTFEPPTDPTLLGVRVERMYPHALDAFTQGLFYEGGWLYESTGLYGSSSLRRVELDTGRIDRAIALDAAVFGEGMALAGSALIQLSYQNERAFVWNRDTFEPEGEFRYAGEGWGLCHDGQRFVMSDGSDVLQLRATGTFELIGSLAVDLSALVNPQLNELECVGGDVFANVLGHRRIVRIDGSTGVVTGWIDTGTLLLRDGVGDVSAAADLNGIAYVPERDRFLLTGKNWPQVFEVAIVPLAEGYAAVP